MRSTKYREQIMNLFLKNKEMLSAEMIFNKLNNSDINLSTVYRTLELFLKEDLISKSVIDHTTYYYLNGHSHHHYMICLSCQKRIKLDCHLDNITNEIVQKNDFKISHHDFTVYGYCKSCQT